MGGDARPEALQVWTQLAEATSAVRASVNRSLQRQAALSLADNLVLCYVALAPERQLKMAELAELLGIAKSAITKTVDRLEDRGLLVRVRDQEDRRAVYAALTPAGATVFDESQPVFIDAVTQSLTGPLTPNELAQLRRILDKLLFGQEGRRRSTRPAPDRTAGR